MYRWMLALVVVLTAVCGMVYRSGTALAADNEGAFICWGTNISVPQCMDLKDDRFTANQPIYLWSSGSGNGLGWNLDQLGTVSASTTSPFTVQSLDTRYNGDPYYYLEKTTATGHNGCVGLDVNNALAWETCGANYTKWVFSASGYLVNIHASDDFSTPIAAAACPTSNGSQIFAGFVFGSGGDCTGPWTLL